MAKQIIVQKWWKVLAVILMAYVLLAGFLIPLRPGIADLSPRVAVAGQRMEATITGYNTHWADGSGEDTRVWLKYSDERTLAARQVEVMGDRQLRVVFELPSSSPSSASTASLSLIVDHPGDGPAILPAAAVLREGKTGGDRSAWEVDPIADLHFTPSLAFPYRNILVETIRNQNFHVPLWFAMFTLFLFSVAKSIHNLRSFHSRRDHHIVALNASGILLGCLGLFTGMIWAEHTWGTFWNWDIKQTMTLIALLIYFAYFILRASIDDRMIRARVSNVYNIFAFAMLFPLLFIIPRLVVSLHPGSGGNPAFGGEDLDDTMKLVFYPAVAGWTLLSFWVASLHARFRIANEKHKMKRM